MARVSSHRCVSCPVGWWMLWWQILVSDVAGGGSTNTHFHSTHLNPSTRVNDALSTTDTTHCSHHLSHWFLLTAFFVLSSSTQRNKSVLASFSSASSSSSIVLSLVLQHLSFPLSWSRPTRTPKSTPHSLSDLLHSYLPDQPSPLVPRDSKILPSQTPCCISTASVSFCRPRILSQPTTAPRTIKPVIMF